MMTITDNEARFLVLEMTVGALVAQLPQVSLEEVVSMLAFVAGLTEDAENLVDGPGEGAAGPRPALCQRDAESSDGVPQTRPARQAGPAGSVGLALPYLIRTAFSRGG